MKLENYKKHYCRETKKAVTMYFAKKGDFEIISNSGGSALSFRRQFLIEISFCPFCGKEMLEEYDELSKKTYYTCPSFAKDVSKELTNIFGKKAES